MTAWFNEIDPVACAVLRDCHHGHVDERSILDVRGGDVGGPIAHFFAGAGLWEVARRMAGWPDDRELWTGSCPCQPLSSAGQQKGHADQRHLWPAFYRLIAERRPATVTGEQVAGAAGCEWFAGVRADLEGLGYACGAADLPACSVGSPQKRNRLWWVAMANANSLGCDGWPPNAQRNALGRDAPQGVDALGNGDGAQADLDASQRRPRPATSESNGRSFWADSQWIECADGKARRAKPGLCLLVDGMAGRPDLWRLAGNSIVPQLAAAFLQSVMEAAA